MRSKLGFCLMGIAWIFFGTLCSEKCHGQAYVEDVFIQESMGNTDSLSHFDLCIQISDTLFVNEIYIAIGTSLNGEEIFACSYDPQNMSLNTCTPDATLSNFQLRLNIEGLAIQPESYYMIKLKNADNHIFDVYQKVF